MTEREQIRLKRLFSSSVGGSWGGPPEEEGTVVPCVRGTDLDFQRLRVDLGSAPIRSYSAADIRNRAATAGDIIIEKSGGGEKQPVGRVGLLCDQTLVMPTNFAGRLRPAPKQDARYLTYVLASLYFAGRTRAAIKQTTGIQNLDVEELLAAKVPRLQRDEQQAIADYLDAETARIDALITKKRRMIDGLEERKAAIMLAAVSGEFGPGPFNESNLAWLQRRPTHWGEVLLRLVATTGSGHTPSRERADWWADPTIPWITTGEVRQVRNDRQETIVETREKISELGLANSSATVHPADTVVLCRTASAGYSGIMGTDMATSQDFATWTCGPLLRPRFLLLCLRAMRPDLLGRLATGSTHKTIYMPDIHALRIPLPPINEQDEAVESAARALKTNFIAMSAIEQQIDLLTERRQALITAAVTGELEIPGVTE